MSKPIGKVKKKNQKVMTNNLTNSLNSLERACARSVNAEDVDKHTALIDATITHATELISACRAGLLFKTSDGKMILNQSVNKDVYSASRAYAANLKLMLDVAGALKDAEVVDNESKGIQFFISKDLKIGGKVDGDNSDNNNS